MSEQAKELRRKLSELIDERVKAGELPISMGSPLLRLGEAIKRITSLESELAAAIAERNKWIESYDDMVTSALNNRAQMNAAIAEQNALRAALESRNVNRG